MKAPASGQVVLYLGAAVSAVAVAAMLAWFAHDVLLVPRAAVRHAAAMDAALIALADLALSVLAARKQ